MEAWRQIPRIAGVLALTALALWMLISLPFVSYRLIRAGDWGWLFLIAGLMSFLLFSAAYFVRVLWRRIYANADPSPR